jgi:transcriptional regulator with XRE-family HTH domain
MDIGKRIKNRRKELELSAEQVAERMGVSPATVYRYESSDIMNMGIDKVALIAEALYTTPAYLMGWADDQLNLNLKQQKLLSQFDMLNEIGQDKAVEYITDLTDNPNYKKNKDNVTITVLPTQKEGQKDTNRIELKIEGDAPYIPKVAAAHHPTGKLSEADKEDIKFLNELVGKLKKEKGE